jgi:hypothetical protein
MDMKTGGQHPTVEHGQFIRIEKYSAVAGRGKTGGNNIFKVASEAMRVPGFCPHVSNPQPPIVLYGVNPISAAERSLAWSKEKKTDFVDPLTKVKRQRKYRSDSPCALVGVVSVPPEWELGPHWDEFASDCVEWLKSKYGEDRLESVLAHVDETCLNLHFWVVPRPSESFNQCHPGELAIDQVGRKAPRVIRDSAYKKAMTAFQDEFHKVVGDRFGLLRQTVKRARISRQEWLRNKWLNEQREIDRERLVKTEVDLRLEVTSNPLQVPVPESTHTKWLEFELTPESPDPLPIAQYEVSNGGKFVTELQVPEENPHQWIKARPR